MLRWFKEKFKLQFREIQAIKTAYTKRENIEVSKNKIAFVMLAANYDNLGDIAITWAQEAYLQRILPADYQVIVVPHDKTFNVYLSMRKLINKDTIITLIGGGNSGTLYEFIEWPRRFLLRHFSDCKIISFPQSVYYGEEKYDLKYKTEFVKLAKRCKNLTVIAREQLSFLMYKEMLGENAKILLVPDIVFTLRVEEGQNRSGVCLVFRKDKEKALSADQEEKLASLCAEKYGAVTYKDTCDVTVTGNGYQELKQFIDTLKTKELVVTDRLHGMILAFIMNTPCISLDNNNHKVKSTYDTWLKNDGRIWLSENADDFPSAVFTEERVVLDDYFEPLQKAILEEL